MRLSPLHTSEPDRPHLIVSHRAAGSLVTPCCALKLSVLAGFCLNHRRFVSKAPRVDAASLANRSNPNTPRKRQNDEPGDPRLQSEVEPPSDTRCALCLQMEQPENKFVRPPFLRPTDTEVSTEMQDSLPKMDCGRYKHPVRCS